VSYYHKQTKEQTADSRHSALLTLENASQHLHHFCALLGTGPYIDTRPQFDFTVNRVGQIGARVMLPISIDPAVRTASSSKTWATERRAKQDAAFEAYKALYMAGLVNENLLPARQEAGEELSDLQIPDYTPSLVQVSPTFDPWPAMARYQQENPNAYYRTLLTLRPVNGESIHMLLFTPSSLPTISEIVLFWNDLDHIKVDGLCLPRMVLDDNEIEVLRSLTHRILYSVYEGRMEARQLDFLWLLAPCNASGHLKSSLWLSGLNRHSQPAIDLLTQGSHDLSDWGLITRKGDTRKYIPEAIHLCKAEYITHAVTPFVQAVRLPKRRDFLHPVISSQKGRDAYMRRENIELSECIVDNLPASFSMFALLFPSILHRLEVSLVAETLRTTLLRPIAFDSAHLPLIIRALTSSATGEDDNYQRLEFLGDCILKFIATIHLMADKLKWPESHLTAKKGKVVSNSYLARATLAAGIDKFVITKRFTGAKWSPRYARDSMSGTKAVSTIERSSKLIADIIESLIGASYVAGGIQKAFMCVQTLLPLEVWIPVPIASTILYEATPVEVVLTSINILETLIGHTFSKKTLLLEALTHASFVGPHVHCSYERLEFLGDAVIDYIVSKILYAHVPPLPHQKMHAIRTAMVNASFLAFRMFETTVPEVTTNKITMQPEVQHRALWQFLRSGSPELNANKDDAVRQHKKTREQINAGLRAGTRFPWHLFALNDAPKFLSDIVESTIGAVYIDSRGDIRTCEVAIRRLGILGCLERIFSDEVDCLHPKERLGHLAVERDVQYVRIREDKENEVNGRKMYKCQVKIGGQDVGGVVEGLKRLNAETIAAWRAVEILETQHDVAINVSSEDDEFFDTDSGGGVTQEN
jgi:dsRNA-specific ribonuclease